MEKRASSDNVKCNIFHIRIFFYTTSTKHHTLCLKVCQFKIIVRIVSVKLQVTSVSPVAMDTDSPINRQQTAKSEISIISGHGIYF